MLIRSVHLENIKSYRDETIELRPGLVAVSGRNGPGKSTILEVVGFARVGFLAATQASVLRAGAGRGARDQLGRALAGDVGGGRPRATSGLAQRDGLGRAPP